jgi:hypothetical protein
MREHNAEGQTTPLAFGKKEPPPSGDENPDRLTITKTVTEFCAENTDDDR